MRHTFKSIAASLVILVSISAFANSGNGVYFKLLPQKNDHAFKVIFKSPENSSVNVQWTNEKGEVIYRETMRPTEGFMKSYDLTFLPDGEYKITLEANELTFSETVKTGDLSNFKYSVSGQAGKNVVLSGIQPKGKEVRVVILDDAREVIYSETLSTSSVVQKKFNFEKIDTDSVTFALYHNDKLFKEESITF